MATMAVLPPAKAAQRAQRSRPVLRSVKPPDGRQLLAGAFACVLAWALAATVAAISVSVAPREAQRTEADMRAVVNAFFDSLNAGSVDASLFEPEARLYAAGRAPDAQPISGQRAIKAHYDAFARLAPGARFEYVRPLVPCLHARAVFVRWRCVVGHGVHFDGVTEFLLASRVPAASAPSWIAAAEEFDSRPAALRPGGTYGGGGGQEEGVGRAGGDDGRAGEQTRSGPDG